MDSLPNRSEMDPWMLVAWIVAGVSIIGSLYFSEVRGFAPCDLCWYQRICMYPVAIILPIAILLRDRKASWYVLALGCAGLLVSTFHNLLYWGILPVPEMCASGVSCVTRYVEYWGFVSLPMMGWFGFAAISLCSALSVRNDRI